MEEALKDLKNKDNILPKLMASAPQVRWVCTLSVLHVGRCKGESESEDEVVTSHHVWHGHGHGTEGRGLVSAGG
jgi:hypothetical protein